MGNTEKCHNGSVLFLFFPWALVSYVMIVVKIFKGKSLANLIIFKKNLEPLDEMI